MEALVNIVLEAVSDLDDVISNDSEELDIGILSDIANKLEQGVRDYRFEMNKNNQKER